MYAHGGGAGGGAEAAAPAAAADGAAEVGNIYSYNYIYSLICQIMLSVLYWFMVLHGLIIFIWFYNGSAEAQPYDTILYNTTHI